MTVLDDMVSSDDWDGDEQPDVVTNDWRHARKQHDCCACKEPIRARDRYHLTRQLQDGRWHEWKHCARCYAICQALWRREGGGWIEYELNCGEVWESPPPEVARLAFLTRDEAQKLAAERLGLGAA